MYTVYCDGVLIHDGSSPSKEIHLHNPTLKMGDNIAGSFDFTASPGELAYDMVELMTSTIYVYKEGYPIWMGRPISESKDFWNNRKITCEGALAFLNDTTQDLAFYENRDLSYFFRMLIDVHNSKVPDNRKLQLTTITVEDDNEEYVYETNYKTTYGEMKDNFLDRLGGHLIVRYLANGTPILDYLDDYPTTSEQEINFGVNLLDFTRNWDLSNLCTVILPKGKELEKEESDSEEEEDEDAYEQRQYTTIESVNGGSKFLVNADAVAVYGRIERTVEFSDCDRPQLLLELGTAYINAMQFDDMQLDVTALDLHNLDSNVESFELLDLVHCISVPHGMDRYFPITDVEIPLDEPATVKYTLNGTTNSTMSASNLSTASSLSKAISQTSPSSTIVKTTMSKVDSLLAEYAHITDGVIDNATIDQARVNNLSAYYAHIQDGQIDNATISYANIDELQNHYAHITNGVIDNAYIDDAYVQNLENHYAHIEDGRIDNAKIGYADVEGLSANYASITNGIIDNATIDQARVNNLSTYYAHITSGLIDNAQIGYANVDGLSANYALIDMTNITNSWIENGVIKDAAIKNEMVQGLSASKLTAGEINASNIRVYNLNASNITVGTINGQLIGTGTVDLDALTESVYTQTDIDTMIAGINSRIDSAIETFTGTVIPTMVNTPASEWTTNDVRDTHVGDIYYVVNPNLPENGYAYRFSKINNVYSWELIRDSDITATLAELNSLSGRVTNIESFDSTVTTWKTNTDAELSALTTAHTTLEASVNKSVKSVRQLWYTKDTTTLPAAPGAHVTNTGVGPNAWTSSVPVYDEAYPNYFYCYEYEYIDGSYSVSDPVYDRAMSQMQSDANGGIISVIQLWTIGPTTDIPAGPTGIAGRVSIDSLLDKDVLLDNATNVIVDSTGADYTTNTVTDEYIEYMTCLGTEYLLDNLGNNIVDNEDNPYFTTLRWTVEVPAYDEVNPNYFYCFEYHYLDGTVGWSEGVFDQATTDAQKKTVILGEQLNYKVDVTIFNELKHVADENSATITRLSEVVTDNYTETSTTVNALSQTVNTTSSRISNLTTRLGLNEDGTAGAEDIVYKYSELTQDLDGFKQTVGETYSTKYELDNLIIGGRNLLRFTRDFAGTTICDDSGNAVYDSQNGTIQAYETADGFLHETLARLTFEIYRGTSVRTLDTSGAASTTSVIFAEYKNVIIPEINVEYVFSMYVRGSSKITAYFTNGTSTETIEAKSSQGLETSSYDGGIDISVNAIWSRVWVKWKATGTATNAYRNVVLKVSGGNLISVCALKFEEGTKASAWTPAPEDGEQEAKNIAEEIKDGIAEQIIQTNAAITSTNESISLKADKAETYTITQMDNIVYQEIQNRAAAIELSTEEILTTVSNTYVSTKSYNNDINGEDGIVKRIETAESAIQQNATSISLKADSSTIYTKSDIDGMITTEITNRNSAISVIENGILQSVSSNYTTKKEFSDMSIGGRNLLMLTETFGDCYISDNNGASLLDSSEHPYGEEQNRYMTNGESALVGNGYNSLQARTLDCTSLATNSYKEFAFYKNVISPLSGNSYVFSFHAKGTGKIRAYFYPNPYGGTCSGVSSEEVENTNSDGAMDFTLTSGWKRYWVRWTVGGEYAANTYRNVLLRLYGGNSATVCGLKFEEGTVATAWSPAIEDSGKTLEEYYAELNKKIDANDIAIRESIGELDGSIIETRAAIGLASDNIMLTVEKKTDKDSIISTINQSAESILISASKVDIAGAAIFSQYSKKADTTRDLHYIYISKSSRTTSVARMLTWVEDDTGDQNTWTTKRPTYDSDFPVLFVACQRIKDDGEVTCTLPTKDDTTTVIDGGHITTGQIDARYIAVNQIEIGSLNGADIYEANTVKTIQTIYYASNSSTKPNAPTSWITDATGDPNHTKKWTIKRPVYHETYSYIYTAIQQRKLDDSIVTGEVILDTTVIGFATQDEALADSHYIYYASDTNTVPTSPTSWITTKSSSGGRWTTIMPTASGYPYRFIAHQSISVSGNVACATPILDTTTNGYILEADAIVDTQYIYCTTAINDSIPTKPSNWISPSNNDNVQGAWTAVRPEYDSNTPIMYVARQTKLGNNTVTTTDPKRDTSTTHIDGGQIVTGKIAADRIDVSSINIMNLSGANTLLTHADIDDIELSLGLTSEFNIVRDSTFSDGNGNVYLGNAWNTIDAEPYYAQYYDGIGLTYGTLYQVLNTETNTTYSIKIHGGYIMGSDVYIYRGNTYTSNTQYWIKVEMSNIGNDDYFGTFTSYAHNQVMLIIVVGTTIEITSISVYANKVSSTIVSMTEQYIYYSTSSQSTSPSLPSSWISNTTGNQNTWTTKRPEYDSNSKWIWVAKQSKYLNGSVVTTDAVLDTRSTTIDGGQIVTGKIAAARLDVSNIQVSALGGYGSLLADEQMIYYSSSSGSSGPSTPSSWISNTTGNQNTWTTKRPKYSASYPWMWVTKQKKTTGGSVVTSDAWLDDTTTVIDGGHILTGTITGNQIQANTITSKLISTDGLSASVITTGTLNVEKLTFKNNNQTLMTEYRRYVYDIKFEWMANNELTFLFEYDDDGKVVHTRTYYYGKNYWTPIVFLEIGFTATVYYDSVRYVNGLAVEYSNDRFTSACAQTTYS